MALLRRAILGTLAAAAVLACPAAGWAQGGSLEYAVKAAYLAKFAPFVEWPPASLAPGAALQVCIAGPDPFGPAIDRAMAGQAVADHRIQLVRLARVDGQAPCHILYIRGSRLQSAAEALAAVRGRPVLTVTDAAERGPAHGLLHFVLVDNRVRFEVDPAAVAASGLMISSKLLNLALVRPRG
jgi:hypothetical protein